MANLEDIKPNCAVRGILPSSVVTVVSVQWFGSEALELTYKDATGKVGNELLYRDDEPDLEIVEEGRPWSFDGDGALFRLVSEAQRIRLAHLFDPVLAVHTSIVEPLPHQITAVYESMLPRQPLRFLLADDPGAGKTIMAGLLIKELIARGDLQRCLVVCPGSLAEQWQDELYRRFHLPFEILTNDKLEAARTGNWFLETNLVIARLDKLSRNEDVQQKLQAPDCRWDLVVCDEAHKMSATFFGGEIKYTKRYRLGQLLSQLTRHFLLMTATPHNGKEEDFQLFMALLDGDRFEGKFRDGVHAADVSDLMRRMVKENLLKFDGTPLFPERIAYTVPYKLSDAEAALYKAVTEYVREEFNRAEALENDKRAGTVGFALTILQRRLASSPEAIYQSLRRRRERLESRLRELEMLQRGGQAGAVIAARGPGSRRGRRRGPRRCARRRGRGRRGADPRPGDRGAVDRRAADRDRDAEASRRARALDPAQRRGQEVARAGEPARRDLHPGFDRQRARGRVGVLRRGRADAAEAHAVAAPEARHLHRAPRHAELPAGPDHTLLGRQQAVVIIHGGMGREERMKAQEAFRHDPEVQVLLATDAAGEGINLQRAHLMVNYDLPWNPNRLEQRFGRIHRIGQTEVCHLWNLVAEETREGDVYRKLLEKLEQARKALGGQVFDVLGKLQFEGRSLRELLIEAIRYGDQPEVRARLTKVVENAFDRGRSADLLEERALAHDAMDASRVFRIREEMERAEARRLQPHYVESFFLEAFQRLGGTVKQREARRYEVTHVPAPVRNRDRLIGIGEPVLPRYERIAFEKALVAPQGQPLAAFVCPGHPLLDAVIDLTLERHRDLLRRGAVLVDERDPGMSPRVLFFLEHAIQDASVTRAASGASSPSGCSSSRSTRRARRGTSTTRPISTTGRWRRANRRRAILARPECGWIGRELEKKAQGYAIADGGAGAPRRGARPQAQAPRQDRGGGEGPADQGDQLLGPPRRAAQAPGAAGKPNARLNSGEARKRADELAGSAAEAHGGTQARTPVLAAAAGGARRSAGRARGTDRALRGLPWRPRRPRSTPRPLPRGARRSSWRSSAASASSRSTASSRSSATTSKAPFPARGGCASSRSRAASPGPTPSP